MLDGACTVEWVAHDESDAVRSCRMTAMWRAAFAVSIFCVSVLGPCRAWAWGSEGHRIVALIAADRLTPAARARVADLLGPDVRGAMEEASTWADEIRDERPETERWHFVDIEISEAGYDAARDCPGEDCVVAQIRRDERLVADARLARPVRAEALRFLIHFVGDIHQPLHCADHHDRGGNEVRVMLGGEETNLHAVWDTTVVAGLGDDPATVSAGLEARITPREARAWSWGGPADWANESFDIAKRAIYGPLRGTDREEGSIQLPDNYLIHERPLAAEQLEKAGVRLAMVLNAVLSGPSSAAASTVGATEMVTSAAAAPIARSSPGGATASHDDVATFSATRGAVITAAAASSYAGQTVTVRGVVSDVHATRAGMTFIDMGGRYPDNVFTAVIFAESEAEFPEAASLDGRTVEITGRVRLYRGKPEIVLRSADQLKVQ